MKKLLLILAITLFVTSLAAQSRVTFINENFDGTEIPEGWQIKGMGVANWSVSNTGYAGGSPNEMKINYNPPFLGISRLVTPAVDLTGITSVEFRFRICFDFDEVINTHKIGIATSLNGSSAWHEAWSQEYSESGTYFISQDVTTEDFGNSEVYFCVFYGGNSLEINNIYIDEISVFAAEELDAAITKINLPDFTSAGDVSVSFNISNFGNTEITSVEADYQFDGHEAVTESFSTNIAPLSTESLSFAIPTNLIQGTYNLTVTIYKVNDTIDSDPDNNSMSKSIETVLGTAQKIPMIEHFSSSTCGPCVNANIEMAALTANNPGKYTYTKYPMNWPGGGDAYYTAENGIRRDYYGVYGVPDLYLDGVGTENNVISQPALDQQYNAPAFAEIRGAFNINGSNINIIIDAMSYIDLNNIKLYVSVNEKTTVNNIGSNGETEFHHIMMKMLEDASGNDISIAAGEHVRFEFNYDMSTTFVEEMDDLEVSAWLQDYDSKEVFNSHFLYENTAHPYPVENLLLTDNADNTITASWDAAQGGNATGYNVIVNSVLVAENTSDLSYTFDVQDGNYYIVEVYALYGDDMTSVKAVESMLKPMNVNEEEAISFRIFPNPAKESIKIFADDNIMIISIYNCVGALIDRINVNANNVEINTAKYNTGVYFINVMQENGMSSTKKLVVTH